MTIEANQELMRLEFVTMRVRLEACERRLMSAEAALTATATRRDIYGDAIQQHGASIKETRIAIAELRLAQIEFLNWIRLHDKEGETP